MIVDKLIWALSVDDKATKGMNAVQKQAMKLAGVMGKAGKVMTAGITAPLVGMAGFASKTAANFDDSMSQVYAITGEVNTELRDLAKELGAKTPHSASAASEAMGILAASGQDANNIMALTPGLLTLMSAGSVDANVAAKALTGTMAQFNMRAEESDRIIDSLAKGAASANTNVGEIQEALKMGGGDMANMNMTVEQATAMVGVLADVNIVGGQAGTT